MAYCEHCGAVLAGGARYCSNCGKSVSAERPPPPAAPASYPPPPAPTPLPGAPYPTPLPPPPSPYGGAYPRPVTEATAIVALILNIIVWPGLGSLIAGRNEGWAQGFLFLFGWILVFTIVGIIVAVPLMIGVWVWGVVTGVRLLQEARPAAPIPPA